MYRTRLKQGEINVRPPLIKKLTEEESATKPVHDKV